MNNIYKVIFDDECEMYVEGVILENIPFTKALVDDLRKIPSLELKLPNINSNTFSAINILIKVKLDRHVEYKKYVIDIIANFTIDKLMDFIIVTNHLGLVELQNIASEYFKHIISDNTVDKIKQMYFP